MGKRINPSWPNNTPQPVRIAIVGEAPGQDEEWLGAPFVGASGRELDTMLLAAGIDRNECLLTNVIMERPPENNLTAFCLRKEELPRDYPIHIGPMVTQSGNFYLHPDRLFEGARLRDELAIAQPNVVVALGATACWALVGSTSIGSLRGVVHRSVTSVPYKVVPTWHPAHVLRQYNYRPVAIADLVKARAESATPAIRHDNAEIWIEPTLDDIHEFFRRFMPPGVRRSWDIETANREITCIGVSPEPYDRALVIPFRCDPIRKKIDGVTRSIYTRNYWPTHYEEMTAWRLIKQDMERHDNRIVGQNWMYDIQYLTRVYGIMPRGFDEDTMLMHHSAFLELPKDLGFLGSIYANYPSWKLLNSRHQDEFKRDA